MSQSEDHLILTTEPYILDEDNTRLPLRRALSVDAYFRSEANAGTDVEQTPARDENELSEQQLREIYDNEEIERFIHLFTTVRCV